jgi:hypothetical protein
MSKPIQLPSEMQSPYLLLGLPGQSFVETHVGQITDRIEDIWYFVKIAGKMCYRVCTLTGEVSFEV